MPHDRVATTTFGPFAILAAIIGPLWWFLGRSADPIHRKERMPKPAPGG